MNQNERGRLEVFLEQTALDWIGAIINEDKYFPRSSRPDRERENRLRSQTRELEEKDLDGVLLQLEKKLDEEDKRLTQVEAKAISLMGFTAIISSFIAGFAQFLFGNGLIENSFRLVVALLYVLIAFSLLFTIILCMKVIKITGFMYPDADDLLELREYNRSSVYREHAFSLIYSFEYNRAIVNDKVVYVRGSQKWFRNSVFLLLVLMVVMAVMLVFSPHDSVQRSQEPIQVIITTPTSSNIPVSPTSINTPSALPIITNTPIATVIATQLPTNTSVITLTATSLQTVSPTP